MIVSLAPSVGLEIIESKFFDNEMYGKIFEDYLSDYDYWAFGDCDLVYGNKLNEVLDRGLFSKPDILSFERMFCCGPLCLIKNDKRINNLFEMADNWRTIVNLPGSMNVNFDEIGCDKFKEFRSGSITLDDCRRVSDNFSSVVARSKEVKYAYVEAMFQDDLSRGGIVRMGADGALRFNKNGQELAVYHYVRAKLHKYFAVKSMPYHGIRGFRITQTGIYNDGWEWAFHSLIGLRRMFVAGCRSIREKIKNRMVARR